MLTKVKKHLCPLFTKTFVPISSTVVALTLMELDTEWIWPQINQAETTCQLGKDLNPWKSFLYWDTSSNRTKVINRILDIVYIHLTGTFRYCRNIWLSLDLRRLYLWDTIQRAILYVLYNFPPTSIRQVLKLCGSCQKISLWETVVR